VAILFAIRIYSNFVHSSFFSVVDQNFLEMTDKH